MPNFDQACVSCGWTGEVCVRPHEHPPCPVCGGETERSWKSSRVNRDEIPGGQWFENGFESPVKCFSHSEHRKLLAARGLEIRARWAGPNDKHVTRWDGADAYTLAAAASLVGRSRVLPEPSMPIEKATLPERFRVEVDG